VKIREIERRRLEATYGARELDVTSDLATSPLCARTFCNSSSDHCRCTLWHTAEETAEADERIQICESEILTQTLIPTQT